MKIIAALAALVALCNPLNAAAGPVLYYEAEFEITEIRMDDVQHPDEQYLPPEWGIDIGQTVVLTFGWDLDRAQQADWGGELLYGPMFGFRLFMGNIVAFNPADIYRQLVRLEEGSWWVHRDADQVRICPVTDSSCYAPGGQGYYLWPDSIGIEDLFINLSCAKSGDVVGVAPPTLACGSELTGDFFFPLQNGGEIFGQVAGELRGIREVPEPTTLALFGLGLAGLGLSRRRRA